MATIDELLNKYSVQEEPVQQGSDINALLDKYSVPEEPVAAQPVPETDTAKPDIDAILNKYSTPEPTPAPSPARKAIEERFAPPGQALIRTPQPPPPQPVSAPVEPQKLPSPMMEGFRQAGRKSAQLAGGIMARGLSMGMVPEEQTWGEAVGGLVTKGPIFGLAGLTKKIADEVKERTGGKAPTDWWDVGLESAGDLAGGAVAGMALAGALGPVAGMAKASKLGQTILTRMSAAGVQGGIRNIAGAVKGEIDPFQAVQNFGVQTLGSIIGVIPETLIPSGAKNVAGQIATDFVYDIITDRTITGQLQSWSPQEIGRWFLTTELPQLAMSAGFAARDYADPNFEANRQKILTELKGKTVESIKQGPPPLPKEEPPAIPIDTRIAEAQQKEQAQEFLRSEEAKKMAEGIKTPEAQPIMQKALATEAERTDITKGKEIFEKGQEIAAEKPQAEEEVLAKAPYSALYREAKEKGIDVSDAPDRATLAKRIAAKRITIRAEEAKPQEDVVLEKAITEPVPETFGQKIKDFIARKVLPGKGRPEELNKIITDFKNERESIATSARIAAQSARNLRSAGATDADIEGLIVGSIKGSELAGKLKLDADDVRIKDLEEYARTKTEQQALLSERLEKSGAPKALTEAIKNRNDYFHRFYAAQVLGTEFKPARENVVAATRLVREGIMDQAVSLASKLEGMQAENVSSISRFIDTGDHRHLDGMNKYQRSIAKQLAAMNDIYSSLELTGDGVKYAINEKALTDAAVSTINGILNRATGRANKNASIFDVSGLHQRKLEGIFRNLFGEVTDVPLKIGQTEQIQKQALLNQAFFNKLMTEGKGKWWSGMRNDQIGAVHQIPDNPVRYGDMAGKWVNNDLKEIITPDPSKLDKIFAPYFEAKSVMRGMKLIGPRTIGRNYATSFLQFALGNGDMLEDGYSAHARNAHSLLKKLVTGDITALRKLEEYQRHGVFTSRQSSQMEDIRYALTNVPKNRITGVMDKLMNNYALIDFPSKVAAYEMQKEMGIKKGMSVADASNAAAAHVRKFYQNQDAVPEFVKDMSKLPFADYPGYFYDSTRIHFNQIINAMQQAQQGNFKPLRGFMYSRLLSYLAPAGLSIAANSAIQAAKKEGMFTKEAEKKEEYVLRSLLPDYYKDAPLYTWWEGPQDKRVIKYAVTGDALNAFPIDSMIRGALESSSKLTDVPGKIVSAFARDRLTMGMFEELLLRTYYGEAPGDVMNTKGIADVLGREDPDKTRIITQSLAWLPAEIVGGQLTPKMRQTMAVMQKQKRGEYIAGTYSPRQNTSDVWLSWLEPVRVYTVDKDSLDQKIRNDMKKIVEGIGAAKSNISRNIEPEHNQQFIYQQMDKAISRINAIETLTKKWYSDNEIRAILMDAAKMAQLNKAETAALVNRSMENIKDYKPVRRKTQLESVRR